MVTGEPTPLTKVNLALGGGGARGFVHVGVLLGLAERGIEISSIVGTSVGALVGAIYAFNRSEVFGDLPMKESQMRAAGAVEQLCIASDFIKFRDINWAPFGWLRKGALKGEKLEGWLKQNLWSGRLNRPANFGDLDFDLTLTATNAETGDTVVLNAGADPNVAIYRGVRASASIQGLFKDITIDVAGEPVRCWDGGTTGNCRFDIAMARDPAIPTIACTLTRVSDPMPPGASFMASATRPMRILVRSSEILMRQIENITYELMSKEQQESIIWVRPEFASVRIIDFSLSAQRKRDLIASGAAAVKASLG
jgi:predicted acylesterase/phospholipase RssA